MITALTNPKFVFAVGFAVATIILASKVKVEKASETLNHMIDVHEKEIVVDNNND